MTFASSFGRVFSPTFQPNSQAVASSWWLSGGIAASDCAVAYQSKGVADLATSYYNLNNPGTNDAVVVPTLNAPDWDNTSGWKFNGSNMMLRTSSEIATANMFLIICCSNLDETAWSYKHMAGFSYQLQDRLFISAYKSGNAIYYRCGTADKNKGPWVSGGVFGLGASGAYRDGVDEELTMAETTSTSRYVGIGGYVNQSGAAVAYGKLYVQAFAVYTAEPSAEQVLAISTAMAAL